MIKRIMQNFILTQLTVIFIMAVLIMPQKAYAASAEMNFECDVQEAVVGDVITVYLTIKAEVLPGNFEGYISYDSEVFEYRDGPACISGSEGMLKVNDMVVDSTMNSRRYMMTFEAIGRGECEFSLLGSPELYEFEDGYLMSVASSPLVVDVKAKSTASDETGLAGLRISPGALIPEFNENMTEYTTSVENNVTRLIVSAHAKELSADVSIDGGDNLAVGENRITITVTAPSGAEKMYVIICTRAEAGETVEPDEDPGASEEEKLVGLKNVEGSTFIFGKYEYLVCDIPEDFVSPEGYVETAVVLDGISVTAYVREDKTDDDFLLMILQHGDSSPDLYCYDRVEKTIQRFASGSLTNIITVQKPQQDTNPVQTGGEEVVQQDITGLVLAIVVLCAICAILLVLTIRLFMKNKGMNTDDLDN